MLDMIITILVGSILNIAPCTSISGLFVKLLFVGFFGGNCLMHLIISLHVYMKLVGS